MCAKIIMCFVYDFNNSKGVANTMRIQNAGSDVPRYNSLTISPIRFSCFFFFRFPYELCTFSCFKTSYFDCSLLDLRYFTNDLAIICEFFSVCLSKISKYSSILDIIYLLLFSIFSPSGVSLTCISQFRLYY